MGHEATVLLILLAVTALLAVTILSTRGTLYAMVERSERRRERFNTGERAGGEPISNVAPAHARPRP
jgi:hypothetical protein